MPKFEQPPISESAPEELEQVLVDDTQVEKVTARQPESAKDSWNLPPWLRRLVNRTLVAATLLMPQAQLIAQVERNVADDKATRTERWIDVNKENETEKLADERRQYQEMVQAIRENAPEAVIDNKAICFSPDDLVLLDRFLKYNSEADKDGHEIYVRKPMDVAKDLAVNTFVVDERLRSSTQHDKKIALPRYYVRYGEPIDSVRKYIIVEDWLGNESEALRLAEQTISTSQEYDAQVELLSDALTKLTDKERPLADVTEVREAGRQVLGFSEKQWNEQEKQILETLRDGGYTMRLSFGYRGEGETPSFAHDIPLDSLLKYGKLKAEHVADVTIQRDIPELLRDAPKKMVAPKTDYQYDKFGNFIVALHGPNGREINYIQVPPPLSADTSKNEQAVDIDLAPLGITGELIGLVTRPVEHPLQLPNWPSAYQLYAAPDAKDMVSEQIMQPYAKGVSYVEKLFGKQPGDLIKRLYVINEEDANAYVSYRDTLLVTIYDEMFKSTPSDSLVALQGELTGRHEAFHIVDRHFSLSNNEMWRSAFQYRGPEERDMFGRLKKTTPFYQQLNESNFQDEAEIIGGHSGDNEAEFFASFMNALTDEKFEILIMRRPPEFRVEYMQTLETLATIINENEQLRSSPLSELIETRLAWFDQNRYNLASGTK